VYEQAGGSWQRRHLHADERGSVVMITDDNAAVVATNRYDEYGVVQGGLTGRFGYTGQAYLPEIGLHYYKARMYDGRLPRFMQTDPLGWDAGPNEYSYTLGDPVNLTDPLGLAPSGCTEGIGSHIPNCGRRDRVRATVNAQYEHYDQSTQSAIRAYLLGDLSYSAAASAIQRDTFYVLDRMDRRSPLLRDYGIHTVLLGNAAFAEIAKTHGEGTAPSSKDYFYRSWLHSPLGFARIISPIINRGTVIPYHNGQLRVEGQTPWPLGVAVQYNSFPRDEGTRWGRIVIEPTGRSGVWRVTDAFPRRTPPPGRGR
jgi:RHS repeat-associated protein